MAKVFVVASVVLAALVAVHASPLAMWVSGDLPAAAEDAARWTVDAAAGSPLPPPAPAPAKQPLVGSGESKAGSHAARPALTKPVVEKRVGCSVAFDTSVYTFGGADRTHGALTNDIARFDQLQKTWELVRRSRSAGATDAANIPAEAGAAAAPAPAPPAPAAGADADAPCARYGHSCAVDGQRMLVYGGFNDHDEALSDLWAYTFLDNQWKRLTSPKPSAAAAAAAGPATPAAAKAKAGAPAPPPPPSAPVYADLAGPAVEYGVHVVTPGGRAGHVSVVDATGKRLWVFGGRNARGDVLNDLFCYDLVGGVWTAVLPPASSPVVVGPNAPAVYPRPADRVASSGGNTVVWPGARADHACVVDAPANTLWCYGGVGYAADPQYFGTLSDVWTFPLDSVPGTDDARWTCVGGSVHYAVNERARYVTPEYVHHFENLPPRPYNPRYYRFQQQQKSSADTSLLAVSSRTAGKARATVLARQASRSRAAVGILPVGPGGRYSPLVTYDARARAVWMFGGRDSSHAALNDLWHYSLATHQWVPYHADAAAAAAPPTPGVSGPLVWPPSYGGAYTYSASALVAGSQGQQLHVFGSRPHSAANDVWQIDLFGRGAMAHGVDVCASNPCAHGGVCQHLPDALLGGGVGYQCRCTVGYTGRHCQVGDHLFRHINNPFVGGHPAAVPDLGSWQPIEDLTKPFPIVDAYVPPAVKPAAPPVPVTVGPARIPSTETRTVQLWRAPGTARPPLPVELHPSLASDPRVIRGAQATLKSTTQAIDRVHRTVRRISNAPLVERNTPVPPFSGLDEPAPAPTPTPSPAPAPAPAPVSPPNGAVLSAAAAPARRPAAGVLQP